MCSDGIDDTRALAQAGIGTAIGTGIGTGTEVAMEACNSKLVKQRLKEHAEMIEVFSQHSYSPGLNLDQSFNADLEQRATKAAPTRTKAGLATQPAAPFASRIDGLREML